MDIVADACSGFGASNSCSRARQIFLGRNLEVRSLALDDGNLIARFLKVSHIIREVGFRWPVGIDHEFSAGPLGTLHGVDLVSVEEANLIAGDFTQRISSAYGSGGRTIGGD